MYWGQFYYNLIHEEKEVKGPHIYTVAKGKSDLLDAWFSGHHGQN